MTTRQISRARRPAIEGWFTLDESEPALLGSRCRSCSTVYFPAATFFCRNPACDGSAFDTVQLSRRGRIWSFTDARYQPPDPYVAAEPYVPFALAAVELTEEQMVVMGQVASGIAVSDLSVGDEVELVLEVLYSDEETDYLVWKWKPAGRSPAERLP